MLMITTIQFSEQNYYADYYYYTADLKVLYLIEHIGLTQDNQKDNRPQSHYAVGPKVMR